ncbi:MULTISPECIES: helix-turn-helix transcriptional regulator [unclassified Nocardioides]|uniref:helix-turn-helix transcriptional regulator n=1 Tax=unclassified Nocardioides TaxID=2615069 RepID=UPI002665B6ED|nr:helix-turn-helix transcriptional regulator [Nocardioides sp. Arc9.136]WKN48179.1 helix-turn-helix transcriptional regulator [Nocardioides sp. Arc9.136]
MPSPRSSSLLSVLGLGDDDDHFYDRVRAQSGRELVSVAAAVMREPEELVRDLQPLVEHGIVRIEDGRVFVASPAEAIVQVLTETAATAARAHSRLSDLAAAVPLLAGRGAGADPGEVEEVRPIDGEVSSGGQAGGLLRSLIERSRGDIRWLRPDQFRQADEGEMIDLVGRVVAQGRRSRAIYPVRALTDAREVLARRAAAGEDVRVLPHLPTRMCIIGSTHAMVPEPLGFADQPRTLVREAGLVEALTLWFESMWERALPVPGLERGDARPDVRRFLLQQLAEGAQDEQIARRLGVSLRTVRRRVADLLGELGADTRFQAGAEAVRRGWL